MPHTPSFPGWKDKALFTPGPLTTSRTVKQAMLRDLGSRDSAFIDVVRDIRRRLVSLGNGGEAYTCIPMQGSGTFSIESVISSTIPPSGKLLTAINGAYGKRIHQMAGVLKIDRIALDFPEDTVVPVDAVDAALAKDPAITHVAVVHCETTTGIINPVEAIGESVHRHDKRYFVDAMSSFGAVPLDLPKAHVDYMVSSANKCIEGVPGFGFVLARLDALRDTETWGRSLSLDLHAQWKGLESNGQFRFTPPTHTLLAFYQALLELEAEGGVAARGARYRANYETLVAGMTRLGFREYLDRALQGYIITSFRFPDHPKFDFERFYRLLSDRGHVIYPGKVSNADCFRVGNIGRLFPEDVCALVSAIRETLGEMGVDL